MMDMFWLNDAKQAWQGMINKGIKPQGVIINGAQGVGKQALLGHIVPVMLCANSNEQACGTCQSCRLNQSGHHPDVLTVAPENNVVKVAMIRQLTDFFVSTPHCSEHKIAVIHQAHLMNTSAANALLKVLEEPPASGTLFLLSEAKHHLLPTIRSRCISLDVAVKHTAIPALKDWLMAQNMAASDVDAVLPLMAGVPLAAKSAVASGLLTELKQFLDDCAAYIEGQVSTVAMAKKWHEQMSMEHLMMWQQYNLLVLKHKQGSSDHAYWLQLKLSKLLKKQSQSADLIIKVNELIQGLVLKFNTQLKKQLMLESALFQFKELILKG